jgi:ABC-type dipeptide/oligopeptide/nickel transport system permease component
VIVTAASSTPTILLALIALLLAASASLLGGEPGPLLYLFGATAIAVPLTAVYLSQTRACLADASEQEYPLTARAKGLDGVRLVYRHLLRPSMGPMISIAGASFGALLSGSVIVEQTLNLPGLGSLSVEAIRFRDVPVVMGVVLISAIAVLAGNLLSDLFQIWNDPRIQ